MSRRRNPNPPDLPAAPIDEAPAPLTAIAPAPAPTPRYRALADIVIVMPTRAERVRMGEIVDLDRVIAPGVTLRDCVRPDCIERV